MLSEILSVAPLVKQKLIKENKNTLTVTQFKRTKQHFITAFHNVADMAVLIYALLGTSVYISATLKIEICRTPIINAYIMQGCHIYHLSFMQGCLSHLTCFFLFPERWTGSRKTGEEICSLLQIFNVTNVLFENMLLLYI